MLYDADYCHGLADHINQEPKSQNLKRMTKMNENPEFKYLTSQKQQQNFYDEDYKNANFSTPS